MKEDLEMMLDTLGKYTILYVEDNEEMRISMEDFFANCFKRIVTVSSADEALALLREDSYAFDIVMSDVNMPKMDGCELVAHIKNAYPHILTYTLSAYSKEDLPQTCKPHFAFFKPVAYEAMLEKIYEDIVNRS